MMEDAAIVGLYWQRDTRAIEETARKYGAYCRAIAQRICPSREDGEECVNDTWLSAWNAMPDKRPDRLSPFLGRIVRNHALHRVEAAGRHKRGGSETALCLDELADCIASTGSAETLVEEKELAGLVHTFLGTLKTKERRIFLARYYYLLPVQEIAARLGCRPGTVKSSLFRSREKLKKALEKEGYVC